MNSKGKGKICWNCEGEVHKEMDQCPYCGTSLSPMQDQENTKNSPEVSLTKQSPPSTYSNLSEEILKANRILYKKEEEKRESVSVFEKNPFSALVFFLPGSLFFIFGLILFIFSQEGSLILSWNARYSFLYIVLGSALSWAGWKVLCSCSERGEKEIQPSPLEK